MAYTINIKECGGGPLDGVTVGNGKCYSTNNGKYVFDNCDSVKACAGENYLGDLTVTPNTLPAAGGIATFSLYGYGQSDSIKATKSKTGEGVTETDWSGTYDFGSFVCPETKTLSLNAAENTSTETITYTVSINGTSKTASVVQEGREVPPEPPTPTTRTIYFTLAQVHISVHATRYNGQGLMKPGAVISGKFHFEGPEGDGYTYEPSGEIDFVTFPMYQNQNSCYESPLTYAHPDNSGQCSLETNNMFSFKPKIVITEATIRVGGCDSAGCDNGTCNNMIMPDCYYNSKINVPESEHSETIVLSDIGTNPCVDGCGMLDLNFQVS